MGVGSWQLAAIVVVALASASVGPSNVTAKVVGSFVFGDSLVDAGNNNYLRSLAKANFLYNGIDFQPSGGKPNGRYTNGRTIPDLLGQNLGLSKPFAPPFLAPSTKGEAILQGVNYASGGGGILNATGRLFIGRLSLDNQITYFEQTRSELITVLGSEEKLNKHLKSSIFSVTIGSNDYIENYAIRPLPNTTKFLAQAQKFQQQLIVDLRRQLTRIYNLGVRNIIVSAVPPIGCTPYQLSLRFKEKGDCAERLNKLIVGYNTQLKALIVELNYELSGATFLYANAYDVALDVINNYRTYGFQDAKVACCGMGGLYKGLVPCSRLTSPCPDRSKYFFWDPYHPSEAANIAISRRFLDGGVNDIFPMNVRQLIANI